MAAGEAGETGGNGRLLDVLSSEQYEKHHIDSICRQADVFRSGNLRINQARYVLERRFRELGALTAYFWFDEASTRTLGSFDVSRQLLGLGRLGHINPAKTASMAKGETFDDSMRAIQEHLRYYGGAPVIMRTKEPGQPQRAAEILDMPVINAGDGQNEHPTQALQDVYTIKRLLDNPTSLNIVLGGDVRYSRTIHSLMPLLPMVFKEVKMTLIGDPVLWLDEATKEALTKKGISYEHSNDMNQLTDADIIYWTRLQKERLAETHEPTEIDEIAERYIREYKITDEIAHSLQDHARILHPLPRGEEIPESLDKNIHAAYWEQVGNGVPVRSALLYMVLRNLAEEQNGGGLGEHAEAA